MRKARLGFLAAVLAIAWAASAQAAPRDCGSCGMIGLARGQVLRVNAAHVGDPSSRPIAYEIVWFDATGAAVARDSQTIQPEQAVFFDVPFEAVAGGADRVELRPVISGGPAPHLRVTLEVFDADTGRTTVFIGDPGI